MFQKITIVFDTKMVVVRWWGLFLSPSVCFKFKNRNEPLLSQWISYRKLHFLIFSGKILRNKWNKILCSSHMFTSIFDPFRKWTYFVSYRNNSKAFWKITKNTFHNFKEINLNDSMPTSISCLNSQIFPINQFRKCLLIKPLKWAYLFWNNLQQYVNQHVVTRWM